MEDLFVDPPDPMSPILRGVEKHLETVCDKFRPTLYSFSVFIGKSVLDQIVYDKIRDKSIDDPIGAALGLIQSVGIHKPGIILYPLHSFGLSGVGILEKLTPYRYELFAREGDLWVRAQTNDLL